MAIHYTRQIHYCLEKKNITKYFFYNMFGQFMPNTININCLLIIFVGYQKQELIIEIEAPI